MQHFLECFKLVLIHGQRENSINLCLDFIAKFAASYEVGNEDPDESGHPFYEGLFDFLLVNHNVKSQSVRFRVCQFINRLLDQHSESASINGDLFDRIYEAMVERVQDRIASVRVQAVIALQRLQDPTNKECPVIKALVFHLERDPHPEVRRAVLRALGCNYFTLNFVLERLQDVNDTVRSQAYTFISERVHVRSLSIANRVTILKLGLKDRSPAVTVVVEDKLIPGWVNAMEGSLFILLRGLDVEGCSELALEVVNVWLKTLNYKEIVANLSLDETSSEDHLVPVSELKPEVALYWRAAVAFLTKEGVHAAEVLETILPEMTAFSKYAKDYVTNKLKEADSIEILSMEFVMDQLLQFAPFFDLADEAGRSNLLRDFCVLLQNENVSPALSRTIIKCFSLLEPKVETRIFRSLEVISELREPLTQAEIPISEDEQRKQKLETAQCRVKLNELKDDLEEAITAKDFTGAQDIQKAISELETKLNTLTSKPLSYDVESFREERDDPMTLHKCLSIVCELLKNAPLMNPKLPKELNQLLETLILPCVERVDPTVRNAAFEALGLLCTWDLELAKQRLLLFVQAVQMDHTALQVTTAKILFDLVQLFGLPSFEDKENGLSLASTLTDLLDNEDADVQTIAIEGFAKLMISSRIESAMILSRLVIFLFHPLTVDNIRLRQVLHVFFPYFASLNLANQQQLESAFIPTLKTIQKAPVTSPLAEIDIAAVVKLFVDLTQENLLIRKPEVEHNIHDMLAMKLCNEALRYPDSGESRIYLKALLQLNPTFTNVSHVRDLDTLTQKLQGKVKDKTGLRLIHNFGLLLRKHIPEGIEEESELSVSVQRPRNRQLLSKNGHTMLMECTASDGELSIGSADVFTSPRITQTDSGSKTEDSIPEVKFQPPSVATVDESEDDSAKEVAPVKKRSKSNKKEKHSLKVSSVSTADESDDNSAKDVAPARRRTRSNRKEDVEVPSVSTADNSDDDVLMSTPPSKPVAVTRRSKRTTRR